MLIYVCHFFTAIVGMSSLGIFFFTFLLFFSSYNTQYMILLLLLFYYTGAEWWAQQFGKSFPFLNWLPFIGGKTVLHYMVLFLYL